MHCGFQPAYFVLLLCVQVPFRATFPADNFHRRARTGSSLVSGLCLTRFLFPRELVYQLILTKRIETVAEVACSHVE